MLILSHEQNRNEYPPFLVTISRILQERFYINFAVMKQQITRPQIFFLKLQMAHILSLIELLLLASRVKQDRKKNDCSSRLPRSSYD